MTGWRHVTSRMLQALKLSLCDGCCERGRALSWGEALISLDNSLANSSRALAPSRHLRRCRRHTFRPVVSGRVESPPAALSATGRRQLRRRDARSTWDRKWDRPSGSRGRAGDELTRLAGSILRCDHYIHDSRSLTILQIVPVFNKCSLFRNTRKPKKLKHCNTIIITRSPGSPVAESPRDASCQWVFYPGHSWSFEMTS